MTTVVSLNNKFRAPGAPSAAVVQSALEELQAAQSDIEWFGQSQSRKGDAPLNALCCSEGAVGRAAAAYRDARNTLNRLLLQRMCEAEAKAATVVSAFLSDLFGTPVPGYVALPLSDTGQRATEYVVGLHSLSMQHGRGFGVVRTAAAPGAASRSSRAFYTSADTIYFGPSGPSSF